MGTETVKDECGVRVYPMLLPRNGKQLLLLNKRADPHDREHHRNSFRRSDCAVWASGSADFFNHPPGQSEGTSWCGCGPRPCRCKECLEYENRARHEDI